MQYFPILYSFRRCPYAIRARLALEFSGVSYELREVSLKNKPHALLACSKKAQVPVLQLLDGQVLDESLDIILWALNKNDPTQCLPKGSRDLSEALNQIKLNDTVFKQSLDVCKYSIRYTQQEFLLAQKTCYTTLRSWDQILSKQAYLGGEWFGLFDLCVLPFVRQFAGIKSDIFTTLDVPFLKEWLHKETKTISFVKIMRPVSVWKENKL